MSENSPDIALFLSHLGGGGGERAILYLARGFAERGLKVDFVLGSADSPHLWRIPSEVRTVDLKAPKLLASLKALRSYLRQEQPKTLLSALHYTNEIALWAKRLSGVSTRVVVCEQNTLSRKAKNETRLGRRLTPFFAKNFYPWADSIVAVSHGVAKDLACTARLPLESIQVIYNPAATPELAQKVQEPLDHPWFASGEPPVILGVGKLETQKDFPTLIRAFARVRKVLPARLMILGWGPDQPKLEALARELGVEKDVALPGYVNNPYVYMARSAVFVLSSAWEGLPFVLVEAMAVGTPVVSTNCESGPAEILANGKYGLLTPVGDPQALAEAILTVLAGQSKPADPTWLKQFTLDAITQQYLDVLGVA
jgi:glycosyltransferase involved in cell wall biosynthesis